MTRRKKPRAACARKDRWPLTRLQRQDGYAVALATPDTEENALLVRQKLRPGMCKFTALDVGVVSLCGSPPAAGTSKSPEPRELEAKTILSFVPQWIPGSSESGDLTNGNGQTTR